MSDDKERRAERTEAEDAAGVTRGLRRKEDDETTEAAKKYGVKQLSASGQWVVYNTESGTEVFKASTQEAAYKKRDELLNRDKGFFERFFGKLKGE